jgi:S1-C subfamily serine protease
VPPEASWHVRIRGGKSGVVVGAGVLIDSRRILTCAHVITKALDLGKVSETPVEAVRIDFPQCAREDSRMARVIAGGWFPEHQSADIAVLEVDGDDVVHAVPAPLRSAPNPEDQMIYALGHPAGYDNGIWARARLIARGGVNPEWVQMEAFSDIGKRIQKGYSGAGVWDEQKRAVIGCVIAADRTEPDRVAWMIPVEIIARYWPDLEGLFQENAGQGQHDLKVRRSPEQRRTAVLPSEDQQWITSVTEQLAAKLGTMSVARDTKSRALLIEALEAQFGSRLQVDRRDGDYDISDFIHACLTNPGAPHELVRLLRRYAVTEFEQRQVEEIDKLVEETIDPDPLLLSSERNNLYSLLGILSEYVTVDMVLRGHREATGWWRSADIDPYDVFSVIQSLESALWIRDRLPPLVHFLEVLALLLPPVPAISDLRSWVDQFSARQGVSAHLISRLRVSPPPPPLGKTTGYVMTELSRDGADERHYLTRITLRAYGPGDQVLAERKLHYDDTLLTMAEIPKLFDSVLSGVWDSTTAGMQDVVMEFVLPLELLGHSVDQWVIKDVISRPLCSEHLVQVRSIDRKTLYESHRYWRRKTVQLRSGHVKPRWVYPHDENDFVPLFQELIDEDIPCLVLTRPPATIRKLGNDPVSIGIRTGVPVIIWCRNEASVGAFAERLHTYLAENNGNAADLRSFVRQMRTENVRYSTPPGSHITLIWDPADMPSITTTRHQAP